MRDKISEPRVALLHPKIRDEVRNLINKAEARMPGVAIRIAQGLRTFEEQDKLYAQGRTTPGKRVTNAKGGSSFHNYGLAFDFLLMYDKDLNGTYEVASWNTKEDFDKDGESDWMEVVDIFEAANYTWGGRFSSIPDQPHFEKTFGVNWRGYLQLYNEQKFYPGTKYVIIP